MVVSEAHAGRQYPPTAPYQVSAAKVSEFAAALGDHDPRYRGADALAPPTFAAVIAALAWQPMFEDPELGLALRRIVHGEQRFTFARPLRVGDRVRATLTLDKVRTRGPADILSTSVALRTVDDELVCTASATFFHSRQAAA